MIYTIQRYKKPPLDKSTWDIKPWSNTKSEVLSNYMGNKPEHFPKTKFKILYDENALYVFFKVWDKYIKATALAHQESVCKDSCAEFFFTPGDNSSKGYFNLEMNCGGIMLFHFQKIPREGQIEIEKKEYNKIQILHSMPKIVNPELIEPTIWTVAYSIPFDLINNYYKISRPKQNSIWRANFYKCADKTSHPHWLTWSPVNFEKPNFHLPDSFGILKFQ